MSASPPPDDTTSTETCDAAGANVPVNIAPPNWQCPHCLTKYREDLEAATRCAEAGPATDVVEGTPVLILSGGLGNSPRRGGGPVVLGRTQIGPVKPVTIDEQIQHQRLVLVAGKEVNPAHLAAAPRGNDGLHILAGTEGNTEARGSAPSLSTYSTLSKIFLGKNAYSDFRFEPAPVPVWFDEYRNARRDGATWWRTPDQAQRSALNTVLNGLLDKVCETDEGQLIEAIRSTYRPNRRTHRASLRPEDLATAKSGLIIAEAHGAPNHIWAMRWIGHHIDEVAAWQAKTLQQWAAGTLANPTGSVDNTTEVVIPAASYLPIPEALPRNPGKKRYAAMEPYGSGYSDVRDAVTAQLALEDPPINPVPDVPDVEDTIRGLAGREPAINPEGN